MKEIFKIQVIIIIILISAFQIVYTSCSRSVYQPSTSGITEKKGNPGIISKIETMGITPDEIIRTAQKYLGVPHCMGGTSTRCIDCSGLLVKVFASHGIYLPHNSDEQSRYGKKISVRDELEKGDLVFFIRSYKTNRFITHSGIYIGNNKFIHASSSKGVTITSMSNPWWNDRFIFGTRLFD